MRSFLFISFLFLVSPVVLGLEVIDEQGMPLAAVVTVNGANHATSGQGFCGSPLRSDIQQVLISAPGFYDSQHAIRCADWVGGYPAITLVKRKPERTLFALAGDVMMGRRFIDPLPGEPALLRSNTLLQDMKHVLSLVKPYLEIADIASVNLETQTVRQPSANPLAKSVTFFSHPSLVEALKSVGVDYVALGNNHAYDFGAAALEETLYHLNSHGLKYSGAGMNEAESRKDARLHGWSLLSYVGWPGSENAQQVASTTQGGAAWGLEENIQRDVERTQDRPLLLQYHGGKEYVEYPTLSQKTRMMSAIDFGADLVVGHHPHVLQGLDLHNDRLIAYSLGNFVFDQYIPGTQLSALLYVWMDGEAFHRAELVPIYLNGYIPTPASGAIRFDILQRVMHLSNRSKLGFVSTGGHAAIVNSPEHTRHVVVDLSDRDTSEPISLHELGVGALELLRDVRADGRRFRLGKDLLKRGSFEHRKSFGTPARVWLEPASVSFVGEPEAEMRVTGSARTGFRTFDRLFTESAPATVSMFVSSSCEVMLELSLQRRDLVHSREEALTDGEMQHIGKAQLPISQDKQIGFDFDFPRRPTKGIRLLIDVTQADSCSTTVDDLVMVEWQTTWQKQVASSKEQSQATHIQIHIED